MRVALLASLVPLTVASVTHAVEPAEADLVRFTTRPVVLPRGALTTTCDLAVRQEGDTFVGLGQRVELSPTDFLAVRLVPATAFFSDRSGYAESEFGARVRVTEGVAETVLGIDLGVTSGVGGLLAPSAAVAVHANETFRFDAALHPTFLYHGRVSAHLDRLDVGIHREGFLSLDFWFALRREVSMALWTTFGADNPLAVKSTGFVGLGMSLLGTIPLRGRPFVDLRLDAGHPGWHQFEDAIPVFTAFQAKGAVSVHGDLF